MDVNLLIGIIGLISLVITTIIAIEKRNKRIKTEKAINTIIQEIINIKKYIDDPEWLIIDRIDYAVNKVVNYLHDYNADFKLDIYDKSIKVLIDDALKGITNISIKNITSFENIVFENKSSVNCEFIFNTNPNILIDNNFIVNNVILLLRGLYDSYNNLKNIKSYIVRHDMELLENYRGLIYKIFNNLYNTFMNVDFVTFEAKDPAKLVLQKLNNQVFGIDKMKTNLCKIKKICDNLNDIQKELK